MKQPIKPMRRPKSKMKFEGEKVMVKDTAGKGAKVKVTKTYKSK